MNFSLSDAAHKLEHLCTIIDEKNSDEFTDELKKSLEFKIADVTDAVDRSIRYRLYAKSQIELAEKMEKEWAHRKQRFKDLAHYYDSYLTGVVKSYPNIPFKGTLGNLKVQRNATPKLVIADGISEANLPRHYIRVIQYEEIDRVRLKDDLKLGIPIEGCSLEYGDHLKVGKDIGKDFQ